MVFDSLAVFQVLILILGGIVVFYASRSYSRTKSRSMLMLSIGFAFVTIGAGLAGILFDFASYDLQTVVTVQAAFQTIGFLAIVYSLLGPKA